MKILCVAEKPSIAKSISSILAHDGGFQSRPGKDKFCRNFDLQYNWGGRDGWVEMTVTSVRGHLTENDFGERYRQWGSCDPVALFEAPVETKLSKDGEAIAANLRQEARRATILMIWTDCDREGEHIGAEVVRECRKANPRIQVKRARFSAIIANQIHAACRDAGELDWAAASAVEARQELDLRVGAALTRLQTTNLQNALPELGRRVMSYGPCQFPTLGFVVDQYEKVRNFVSEDFWHISVTLKRREAPGLPLQTVTFAWRRGHLFDKPTVEMLHEGCKDSMDALVTKVTSKPTRKFKPCPLTTVELQKSGSRLLRMAPKRILDLAEALYNKGFLSYPRTETDQYDAQFDFHSLIRKQTSDGEWGAHAQRLLDGDAYDRPRNGKKNDKAHPPIHPTAHANNLSADEKRVYDYVTRRFLASCSKDATGKQTNIEIELAEEFFGAGGLVIHERNYLDVFPYDKWGDSLLPPFEEGERFRPSTCVLKQGSTSAPNLLTEADLVNLMDKNGIGTDATIAEHISKVIAREYVEARQMGKTTYLMPSTLGMGLVDGYNGIDFEKSLCKPLLRRETEFRMNLICEGQRTKDQTLEESIAEYRAMYLQTKQNLAQLIDSVRRYVKGEEGSDNVAQRRPTRPANGRTPGDAPSDDEDDDGDDGAGGGVSAARPNQASSSRQRSTAAAVAPSARTAPARPAPPLQRTSSTASTSVRPPFTNMQDNHQPPQCRCGEAAVKRTVVKEGPSKGKKFWSCEKGQSDGSCGFFDWAVDDQGGVAGPSRTNETNSRAPWTSRANEQDEPLPAWAVGRASNGTASMAAYAAPAPRSPSPDITIRRQASPPRRTRTPFAPSNPPPARSTNGNGNSNSNTRPAPARPAAVSSRPAAQPQALSREEIDARNDDIALLDELAAMSSQGNENGFDESAERIDEYRAWFASLAADAGGPSSSPSTFADANAHANGNGNGNRNVNGNGNARGGRKRCECGLEASLKTVSKEGPTKGRRFYCCPKENASVRCRMFEWEDEAGDEDDEGGGGSGGGWTVESVRERTRGAGGGGGGTSGSCYKCSREGHWAKDCPGEPAGAAAGPSRGGAGGASRGGGQCFKCGEEGHWSSDCPNDGPTTNGGGAGGSGFGRGSGGRGFSSRGGRGRGGGPGSRGGKRRATGSGAVGGGGARKKRR